MCKAWCVAETCICRGWLHRQVTSCELHLQSLHTSYTSVYFRDQGDSWIRVWWEHRLLALGSGVTGPRSAFLVGCLVNLSHRLIKKPW